MDKNSRLLIRLFLVTCLFVGALLISRFYIQRNYALRSEVECDPQSETCFVRPCTEECEAETEATYYKLRTVMAYDIPVCDPHRQECPELRCSDIGSCEEELCTENNVPDGESCNNPDDYKTSLEEAAQTENAGTDSDESEPIDIVE